MKICVEIGGRQYCLPILVARLDRWGPPPPPNDPLKDLRGWITQENPDPTPWVTDLPILATIERLTSLVRDDELRRHLESAVEGGAKQLAGALPSGMKLEMGATTAA